MRKFALVLMLALALPAAAAARYGDKGDGTLVLKNARGQVKVVAVSGSALGRIESGTIVVTDTSLDGSDDIQVVGKLDQPAKSDKLGTTTTYVGQKLRFRIVGDGYIVTLVGKGINVTAVGKGTISGMGVVEGQVSADSAPFTNLGAGAQLAAAFGLQ